MFQSKHFIKEIERNQFELISLDYLGIRFPLEYFISFLYIGRIAIRRLAYASRKRVVACGIYRLVVTSITPPYHPSKCSQPHAEEHAPLPRIVYFMGNLAIYAPLQERSVPSTLGDHFHGLRLTPNARFCSRQILRQDFPLGPLRGTH